jgi:hypothetical protein
MTKSTADPLCSAIQALTSTYGSRATRFGLRVLIPRHGIVVNLKELKGAPAGQVDSSIPR